MKNIIFIAPPAAGKGTQSEMLSSNLGYEHISTGMLLRSIARENSPLGLETKAKLQTGELFSDEFITEILKKAFIKLEGNKFILDGFPRTLIQAQSLKEIFTDLNITDYVVIYLDITEDMAKMRMLGRLICDDCGITYSKYYEKTKPKNENICDKCNYTLTAREDDTEEAFKVRFQSYITNILPILNFYENLGVLRRVEVGEEKMETYERVLKALKDGLSR